MDDVWCADITYITMEKGHGYLVAIMDWLSRAVLAWEISNTMDSVVVAHGLTSSWDKAQFHLPTESGGGFSEAGHGERRV